MHRIYRVRIESKEPVVIRNEEIVYNSWKTAIERAYLLARRTSYMVNAPNRTVYWAVDRWSMNRREWVTCIERVSRLREGASPV